MAVKIDAFVMTEIRQPVQRQVVDFRNPAILDPVPNTLSSCGETE
jgi:hypothetical protein